MPSSSTGPRTKASTSVPPTRSTRPSLRSVPKAPGAVAVTSYVPSGRSVRAKVPPGVVSTVVRSPVSRCSMATAAPATGSPAGSRTVPRTTPVVACAWADPSAGARAVATASSARGNAARTGERAGTGFSVVGRVMRPSLRRAVAGGHDRSGAPDASDPGAGCEYPGSARVGKGAPRSPRGVPVQPGLRTGRTPAPVKAPGTGAGGHPPGAGPVNIPTAGRHGPGGG